MKTLTLSLLFFAFSAVAAENSASTLSNLQTEYKLTDAQVTSLKNSGLPNPQLAMVAGMYSKLPKDSTTTVDDILKMRADHMGWGEIAKKLGLPPREIGQAVAAEHRQNGDKQDKHHELADRASRRDERNAAHADRSENRKNHDHGKSH